MKALKSEKDLEPLAKLPSRCIHAMRSCLTRSKARGEIVGIGPFVGGESMGIFRARWAAEAFAKEDPVIIEGLINSFVIRKWDDTMLDDSRHI